MNTGVKLGLAVGVGLVLALFAVVAVSTFSEAYARSPSTLMRGMRFPSGVEHKQLTVSPYQGGRAAFPPGGLGMSVLNLVDAIKVTSVSIAGDTKLELGILYERSGSPPATTILVMAGKLTGSKVLQSWSSPGKVTITLTGEGSLNDERRTVVIIVPFTG